MDSHFLPRFETAPCARAADRRRFVGGAARVAVFAGLGGLHAAALALQAGAAAPALELPGPDGVVSLNALRGKVVYLDFWASWCKPCRQSFPFMNDLQQRYGAQGLQIVGVNVDARTEDARGFLASNPAKFAIAFDAKGESPRAFGVKGMPTSFVLGRDGKVLMQHTGFHDNDRASLEAAIRSHLGIA